MKPTPQITHPTRQRDAFASGRNGSCSSKVEYFFQSPSPEFSGHRSGDSASFRGISREYFAREAGSHFKSEVLFFGLIVVAAAIPMIESVRGLAQFVYGVL